MPKVITTYTSTEFLKHFHQPQHPYYDLNYDTSSVEMIDGNIQITIVTKERNEGIVVGLNSAYQAQARDIQIQ